jgi:hypothetical protein
MQDTLPLPPALPSGSRLSTTLRESPLMGANAVLSRELRVALRNERSFAILAVYVRFWAQSSRRSFPPMSRWD